MSSGERKVKKQSRFFLKLIILILFMVSVVQAYIILKTRRYIKEISGSESLVKFVETELDKDKKNVSDMFNRFLNDTSYKGKPLKEMKKEDITGAVKPIKEKFEKWYSKKFGETRITHTTAIKGDKIIVTVQIPGVRKESVDITVAGDIIKMSGELKGADKQTFRHSILVPDNADEKDSKVEFDAGPNKIKVIFGIKL